MDLIGPYLPAIVAAAFGCSISVIGYVFARRSGLGPVQAEYIRAMEGLNDTLDKALAEERERVAALEAKVGDLEGKVKTLEATVVRLSNENTAIKRRTERSRS